MTNIRKSARLLLAGREGSSVSKFSGQPVRADHVKRHIAMAKVDRCKTEVLPRTVFSSCDSEATDEIRRSP